MLDVSKQGGGSSAIEDVVHRLVAMLQDGLEVFHASSSAVFGRGASKEAKAKDDRGDLT